MAGFIWAYLYIYIHLARGAPNSCYIGVGIEKRRRLTMRKNDAKKNHPRYYQERKIEVYMLQTG